MAPMTKFVILGLTKFVQAALISDQFERIHFHCKLTYPPDAYLPVILVTFDHAFGPFAKLITKFTKRWIGNSIGDPPDTCLSRL
jgi:hypothetical protein